MELLGAAKRSAPALDHVGNPDAARRGRRDRLQLLHRLRRLDEDGVDAQLGGRLHACAGLVEIDRGAGVGAGDDEELVAHVDRGSQLGQPVLTRHDLLARHVPAPLRPHLVLEEDAGGAGVLVELDRADGVERVAVAGVAVDDHDAVRDGVADAPGGVRHLRLCQVAEVRYPEEARGRCEAGQEHVGVARLASQERGQAVEHAGQHDALPAGEAAPETGRGAHAASSRSPSRGMSSVPTRSTNATGSPLGTRSIVVTPRRA